MNSATVFNQMKPKLEIDTGDGFKTIETDAHIKIIVDDEAMLKFSFPTRPANRDELIEILAIVVDQLRPDPVVVTYRMM